MGASVATGACVRSQGSRCTELSTSDEDFFDDVASPLEYEMQAQETCTKTLIIWDWDDTLLCSSAIKQEMCTLSHLELLSKIAESLLKTAMELGETIIVTNGKDSWVQDSASLYLPKLLPILARLKIVSARALHESTYPADPMRWKRETFKQLIVKERGDLDAKTGLNLVVIGDQRPEIEAARFVATLLGNDSKVKTVKLHEFPSVGELFGQLGRIERDLCRIVKDNASASRVLQLRRRESASDDFSEGQACSWRCVVSEEGSFWNLADPLGLKETCKLCV